MTHPDRFYLAGVMGMEYDRATGYLWAICDDGCSNMASLLEIDTRAASATLGRFRTTRRFERPATMPTTGTCPLSRA